MNPQSPDEAKREAATRKVLSFFSHTASQKLKEQGAHPAMRVVKTRGGLKLKTYIAEGAQRMTGMHVLKQGDIQVVLGDMLKGADAYYPVEPGASSGRVQSRTGSGRWHNLLYYGGDTPKDIIGTIDDITRWFAAHEDHAFVIKQQDKDVWDDEDGRDEDWFGPHSFTAQVRLVSFAKKGDKGYIDLGGIGTGVLEAFKGIVGLGTAGIGNMVPDSSSPALQAVREMVGTTPDVYDISQRLGAKKVEDLADTFAFDIDLAKEFLELAVTVHEGAGPIRKADYSAHHVWTEIPERGIKPESGGTKAWPVISVHRIGTKVVDDLIPQLFAKLASAAS